MPNLTVRQFLITVVCLLTTLIVMRPQAADPDLYWHLRSGEIMLETGAAIKGDVFSHTLTGGGRVHYEWLSEVILSAVQRVLADYGLTLLAGVFSLTALWAMYRLTMGSLGVRLLLLLLAANTSMSITMARPQAWMVLFTVILVGMVLKRGPSLWWIPVIMLAWANLHGGWVSGYLVLGAAIFAETVKLIFKRGGDEVWLRRLILWSLVGVLALTLNPYGSELLLVPLRTVQQGAFAYINEWLPPDLTDPSRFGFVVLLVLGALVLIVERRRIPLLGAILLIGFGLWSLKTSRIVPLYSFIAPIILSPYLSDLLRRYAPRLRLPDARLSQPLRFGFLAVIILSLIVAISFVIGSSPTRITEIQRKAGYPLDAIAFLQSTDSAERELFNTYNWGGYLIYSLRDYPVFIDGRGDLYGDFFFVYLDIMTVQPGWQDQFSVYKVNTVLISPNSRLAQALVTEPGWALAYQDPSAVVYIRR